MFKVYPRPGAARGVWALPQPPPCNMAAEEALPACSPLSPDTPAAPPRITTNFTHLSDLHQLIFEAVRSGYESTQYSKHKTIFYCS